VSLKLLLQHRQAVIRGAEREIPEEDRPGAIAELERLLAAAEGRSKAIARQNGERGDAIAAGILEALGALPLRHGTATLVQRRIERAGAETFGLAAVPCLPKIRATLSVIAACRQNAAPIPVFRHRWGDGRYASTMPSS